MSTPLTQDPTKMSAAAISTSSLIAMAEAANAKAAAVMAVAQAQNAKAEALIASLPTALKPNSYTSHIKMNTVELSLNSLKEYYLGDKPGSLQYKKTKEELLSIKNIDLHDSDCGYIQVPGTPDLLKRFVPNTTTGKKGDWELLVVFKSTALEGEIWMKGALKNKTTGEIALMTCTNKEENITSRGNRSLKSMEAGWFVGRYRMGAPMIFWRAVVAAVA